MSIADDFASMVDAIRAAHPGDAATVSFEVEAAAMELGDILGRALVGAVYLWYLEQYQPVVALAEDLGLTVAAGLPAASRILAHASDRIAADGR